jgi:hypothetical protein
MTHGTCACHVHCAESTLHDSACCAGVACNCGCHRGRARQVEFKPFRMPKAAYLREMRRADRRSNLAAAGQPS